MPKCSECGAELAEDSRFCPECGAKVTIEEEDDDDTVAVHESDLPEIRPMPSIKEETDKDENDTEEDDTSSDTEDVPDDTDKKQSVKVDTEETRKELEEALEDIPVIKKIDGIETPAAEEKKTTKTEQKSSKTEGPSFDGKTRRDQTIENAINVQKATELRNKALSMDLDEPPVPQKPKPPMGPIVAICLVAALIIAAVLIVPKMLFAPAPVVTEVTEATTTETETETEAITTTVTTTETTTVTTTVTTVTTTSAASSETTVSDASETAISDGSEASSATESSVDEINDAADAPMYNRTSIEPAIHKEVMGSDISCSIKLSEMLISTDLMSDTSAIAAEYTTSGNASPMSPVGMMVIIDDDKIEVPADAYDETTVVFMYPTILAYVEDAGHTADEINELAFRSMGMPVDVYKITVE